MKTIVRGFSNANYKWLLEVLYKNMIFTHFFFSGRDYQHSLEMQKILKNVIQSVDVFLLLFSGASTRYEKNGENPNSSSVFFFKNPRLSILIIYNYLEAVTATPTIRGISSRRFSGIDL